MWVYMRADEPNVWTVGFFKPDGSWYPESDFLNTYEAAARVHYLNGGS